MVNYLRFVRYGLNVTSGNSSDRPLFFKPYQEIFWKFQEFLKVKINIDTHISHAGHHLSQRTRESIEGKLTYPEFLTMVFLDEILGRSNIKLTARIKRAKIRSDKTIENFDFEFNSKINRAQIHELASCRFIAEKIPVLIVGPCGTGKSHLAQALAHCAIRQEIDAIWLSQSNLFSELQSARAAGRYEKKFAELARVPLLLIDDFGLRPMRSPQSAKVEYKE